MEMNGSSLSACNIPQVDPWDATILKYYSKPKPLSCKALQNNVTVLRDGVLMVLNEYREQLKCRCRTFQHYTGVSDFDLKYDDWVNVNPKEFIEMKLNPIQNFSPFEKSSAERPSVLMFGFDGMSRSNFVRVLPKTHTQLQKMGFIDLRGHIKIGDNTFPNLCAILTGKRSSSTRVTPLKEFKGELPDEWNIYFDDWPFVWNNFSEQGYVTLLAEDRPDIGTFNYLGWLRGFKYPPTDHYLRPYWVATYWSLLFRRSSPNCYDRLPAHALQLNYMSQFLTKYAGTRSFALHWTQDLSHDYLNAINVADEDYERFFVENSSNFNNTIVIVFSDHGHRYDAIRETVVGRLEARLPFASILLPKEFVKKFPHTFEALRKNSEKMTTPFDFYATLINIALGNFSRTAPPETIQRGYNLLAPIPTVRQCYDANVPEDYCPCFYEVEVQIDEAKQAASELINFANAQLARTQSKSTNKIVQVNFS
ncbi:unnamed protein product [Toxocara canis]|uniref:Uncharacterized protein n=1 Tax=Toxocara canis TaxID=6265 RepID=A0A3P7GVF2_TOXCA|nr:unnamed protein product [Toxocara canis]